MATKVLIHAPSGAEAYRDWLLSHGCPAVISVSRTEDEAAARVPDVEVIFCWRFPTELFSRAPKLRWVQSMGAGVDDLVRARGLAPDVRLTRVVGAFGASMAEYVFAALLSRVRDLPRLLEQQRRKEWRPFRADTLEGRTIGVAGLGFVGREIVKRARAFGMRVHGLSRSGRRADFVDRHFGPGSWIDFVRDLDFLVLALPLTPETEGIVDGRVLAAMQPGAVLVNVGRGRLVREAELVEALRAGRIAGAVLDVFEVEPLPAESPLWEMENVLVTPHVSGPSRVEQVASFFLDNLRRFQRGEPLLGEVDRERGY
ncbi:MAG: D-2-hydroxyacid dehydrogenase [Clostridia bacterium]|nr:D-2-hydroxyacid dehydrogenase [Clostridia bacterium]